jgi:thiol-disulfide isomerase/thioredoxin/cell division protein ZapA (FtsZ GTPase activity inhibitor)
MKEASPSWKGAQTIEANHPLRFNTNRADFPLVTEFHEAVARPASSARQELTVSQEDVPQKVAAPAATRFRSPKRSPVRPPRHQSHALMGRGHVLDEDRGGSATIPRSQFQYVVGREHVVFRGTLAWRMGVLAACLSAATVDAQQNPDGQLPLASLGNPLIMLLRDEVVLKDLKVTPEQRDSLASLAQEVDALVWPARNQTREKSIAAWEQATARAQAVCTELLSAPQRRRIEEIIVRIQGPRALARDDLAGHLELKASQREAIQKILETTDKKLTELQEAAGKSEEAKSIPDQVRRLQTDEQRQILKTLTANQRTQWTKLAGPPLDVTQLGRVTFAAPALIEDESNWLNPSHAGTKLEGRVAVVHFFANGCINCQRNYPHYLKWQETFRGQDLLIVGIHTPETKAERDVEQLRERVAKAGFEFPILVDNELQNWNAWGNSWWPSVYLVDRRGRIRYWWYGELNWQGNQGEARMRQRITELLAEGKASASR